MTDHELMNEILDRDHTEFEEVCRHEQAEADAEAAYLEKLRQPTPQTPKPMRHLLHTHHRQILRLKTEISLLRQQVRHLQDWRDATHSFIVEPALRDEEEAWKEKMRGEI